MAHIVMWDVEHNRPVVDGKITNPVTGLVEEAGKNGYQSGPPSADVIWHNMYAASDFKTVRESFPATVDEVYLEIADHIRDGLYHIISVCASAYSSLSFTRRRRQAQSLERQ